MFKNYFCCWFLSCKKRFVPVNSWTGLWPDFGRKPVLLSWCRVFPPLLKLRNAFGCTVTLSAEAASCTYISGLIGKHMKMWIAMLSIPMWKQYSAHMSRELNICSLLFCENNTILLTRPGENGPSFLFCHDVTSWVLCK